MAHILIFKPYPFRCFICIFSCLLQIRALRGDPQNPAAVCDKGPFFVKFRAGMETVVSFLSLKPLKPAMGRSSTACSMTIASTTSSNQLPTRSGSKRFSKSTACRLIARASIAISP